MSDESEVLATMVVTIAALRSRAEAAERHAEELAGAAFWVCAWDGSVHHQRTFSRRRRVYRRTLRAITRLHDLLRAGRQMPGEGRP